jgi:SPP1 family predicted phage head-tail adaptor
MIDPGRFNRRLVLEAPVETPDGAGGVTRAFMAFATIWGEVTPVSARGEAVAQSGGATVTHRILIRAGHDISTGYRLRLDARVFRIVAMRDHDRSGRLLEILAEERTD